MGLKAYKGSPISG